ncbi:2-hydroxy-6-oxo-2,4-heptadienoate hydrolase [Janthinobacterium sp. BJB412]|nr:2-hydroxy-6-oxo-2,4-heptadienoate hydrolase [Janthinobacterium sp. BJB412]
MDDNPEIGRSIVANGIATNYHDAGTGPVVLLIHGSGPGVTAWANWRLTLGALAQRYRVVAPDMVGFGYTERPAGVRYTMENWVAHILGFMDALGIERAHVVGNSFGGGLALALAIQAPQRVRRLVLMGSAGLSFPLTEGLDKVWGYAPSIAAMRGLLDVFAYNRDLVTDELARMRYEASVRPGCQEAFSSMFPSPRQRGVDALASAEASIAALPHPTLVVHGREDKVIPLESSYRLFGLIPQAQLHVFGQCGHWTQIEHAGRFNALLDGFFGEDA